MRLVVHTINILILSVVTQIGGLLYLISLLCFRKATNYVFIKRLFLFLILYGCFSFLLIPRIAPFFGREKITETPFLESQSIFYRLANRNYVTPELNTTLKSISSNLQKEYSGIKLIYLDANFPFFNNFPLLPHLSHSDGKKIDLSFIYQIPNGQLTNLKPSISGYGIYEEPNESEINQASECLSRGFWQYDFPKYLSFGNFNKSLKFSEPGTKTLLSLILKESNVEKIFIEPHLKSRLDLNHSKLRFHGCQAVRHDDHIHLQIH